MAPLYAVPRLLERNGLALQDFDFYEIHEAFAAQVAGDAEGVGGPGVLHGAARPRRPLGSIDRDEAERERLVARGRPPVRAPPAGGSSPRWRSCSHERGSGRGLISICAAGGQGVVAILERRAMS